jgi:lipopolysaccharide export system permease protein
VIGAFLRQYAFGILPRYVFGQLVKAFALALTSLSCIFVLFVVVPKVAEAGLGPTDILVLVPLALPSTLPYSAPLALLFAVSVVYGRIASDNEVIAAKACGLGIMTMLWPSFLLGTILSVALLGMTRELIPRTNHEARNALMRNLEDMLYRVLKRQREFDNKSWPFRIKVGDVQDRVLIDAYFIHRKKDEAGGTRSSMQVFAEEATIHFNEKLESVEIRLSDAVVQGNADQPDFVLMNNERIEIPLAREGGLGMDPPVQELTSSQLVAEQVKCLKETDEELRKQAVEAALTVASGRARRVKWPEVGQAIRHNAYLEQRFDKLETEKHMRTSIACGAFFFVLLGAPVGVWRARGDFLSAFMTCFVPIITLYYPLTLAGVNLGKEGQLDPFFALWMGNALLGVLGGLVLRPVRRH